MADQEATVPLQVSFSLIEKTLQEEFTRHFTNYKSGLVLSDPGGFVLTPEYAEVAEKIYNLPLRPDDAWVVTFPKCGTTWTQELVWLVTHDCDFEGAKQSLHSRAPFLEFSFLFPKEKPNDEMMRAMMYSSMGKMMGDIFETIANMKAPRNIKSHLPLFLLPPKLLDTCKVVYVARNPKDTIVSYYHHHRLIKKHGYDGNLEDFAEFFMKDELIYSPFFDHIKEAWQMRHHPNLHFMFYEDMKRDLKGEIQKVAAFFNKTFTDDQFNQLTEHLKFDNFSKNEAVNSEDAKKIGIFNSNGRFIRKGKTGDWKNHFDPELNSRIEQWIENNMQDTDLRFVMELEHQD